MDSYSKNVLTIIAVLLAAIAVKLYLFQPPTYGDFIALRDVEDAEVRKQKHVALIKALPLVRIQGGQVDAEVSGSVSID